MIKYGPRIIYNRIAEIFDDMAESGDVPGEITKGILIPLPKARKPQGQPTDLRSVILLTILRKILAICILERTSKKIRTKIPSHKLHMTLNEVPLNVYKLLNYLLRKPSHQQIMKSYY